MNPARPESTLLIVDDTPANVAVLFDFLIEKGFQVLVCESGQAAHDTLEVEEPDLILLDVMMPGLDGFETCRRIKQLPAGRDVPVFFMTALGDPIDKVRGLEAGAIDYLTKPVYPDEVLGRVRAHLEIRQLQKRLQEQNDRLDASLQRSIVAEQALSNSLDAALLARHGGVKALRQWLASPSEVVSGTDGMKLHLTRKPNADSLLVTLVEQRPPVSPENLRRLGLTPRETEILFWIAQRKTSPEIAIILNMQVCTVKKHARISCRNSARKTASPPRCAPKPFSSEADFPLSPTKERRLVLSWCPGWGSNPQDIAIGRF